MEPKVLPMLRVMTGNQMSLSVLAWFCSVKQWAPKCFNIAAHYFFSTSRNLLENSFFSCFNPWASEVFFSSTFSLFSVYDCKKESICEAEEQLFLFLCLLFSFFARLLVLPFSSSSASLSSSDFELCTVNDEVVLLPATSKSILLRTSSS